MAKGTRRERYLKRKYDTCKALMAEKRAVIHRLECELAGLELRKERLGLAWLAEMKREDDVQSQAVPQEWCRGEVQSGECHTHQVDYAESGEYGG